MRRFVFILLMFAAVLLAACGHGSHVAPAGTGIAANLTLNPTTMSLTAGDVGTMSASMTDKFNSAVTNPPTVAYSSSNTAIVNVAPNGLVCAGTWDANYIVCTPNGYGNAVVTGTVNVKATKNTSAATLTATVPVYVHPRVDRVAVSPQVVDCISMGGQQQLIAQAFSGGQEVTSLVGPPRWIVSATSVASVDSASVAAATRPGMTTISASVAGVNSLPMNFTTCPVARISVHTSGGTDTSATLSSGGKATFAADVYDSKGVKISPPLTWFGNQPVSVSVDQSGGVTALTPPGISEITAACLPSAECNAGLGPTYGNLVKVTVTGTENPALLATGTGTTSIVPIDTSANTAGTAGTLPATPNSMVVNKLGQNALLGSSSALIFAQATGTTSSQSANTPGRVLAASSDNGASFVSDLSRSTFYLVNTTSSGSSSSSSYSPYAATAAAFSPDNNRAFVAGGSTLIPFVNLGGWSAGSAIPMQAPANDLTYLPSGQFLYIAGGAPSAVTVLATYDNSPAETIPVPATPLLIRALPDGSQVLAVDNDGIDVLTPTSTLAGIPPTVSDTVTRVNFGASVTPRQIIATADSAHLVIVTDQNQLLVYDAATKSLLAPIAIANGANCFSGGASTEGTRVWLGCSDNKVHRFDFSTMSDAAQVGLSFTPDLVAVVPK